MGTIFKYNNQLLQCRDLKKKLKKMHLLESDVEIIKDRPFEFNRKVKKERMEILQASVEDIRGLADIVDSVVKQNRICVVGSEEKIQQEKEFFKTIKHLL